jgi:4-alpha-glucanotransferase
MLMLMLLFFAGTAPDVMKHKGQNWENVAVEAEIERALEAEGKDPHGEHAQGHDDAAH